MTRAKGARQTGEGQDLKHEGKTEGRDRRARQTGEGEDLNHEGETDGGERRGRQTGEGEDLNHDALAVADEGQPLLNHNALVNPFSTMTH